jgi:hypothetical protein
MVAAFPSLNLHLVLNLGLKIGPFYSHVVEFSFNSRTASQFSRLVTMIRQDFLFDKNHDPGIGLFERRADVDRLITGVHRQNMLSS